MADRDTYTPCSRNDRIAWLWKNEEGETRANDCRVTGILEDHHGIRRLCVYDKDREVTVNNFADHHGINEFFHIGEEEIEPDLDWVARLKWEREALGAFASFKEKV